MSKKFINFEIDDSVSKYFKDVRKSIILTPKQEIELAKKIRLGDSQSIEKLVNANLKFVISIAKEYQGQGMPLSDLISEGNFGLIKAAHRFDHRKGFRFISYAVWWVRQSIIQGLNDNARMVRLPSNIINKLSYLKKQITKFENENEREPVYGEIFDKNNEVIPLLKFPKCSSLHEIINEDGDELIEIISIPDNDEGDLIIDDKIKEELNTTLALLDERERVIVESYFGVNSDFEPMTLEAIGEKYGLTKERIRQIKERAIRKLRHNAHGLYNLINE